MTSSARANVGAHDAGEVAGPFDSGFGVQVAADVLDRFGNVAGASLARALESHVLEEVRKPVLARALMSRAGRDEDADRRGLHMRHRVGRDGEAGGKGRDLNAHRPGARAVLWR